MLEGAGRWLNDNSSLLSAIAALAALVAMVVPVLGRGAKHMRGTFGRRETARGAVGNAEEPSSTSSPSPVAPPTAQATGLDGEPLLAVLAFDNLSNDPEMQYFSDGVSEEIIQRVARGSRIKVIGRLSSFQFRGERKAAATRELRCTHVLDGSVRRGPERVRINAQLIEAGTHTALWSDSYERALADVFAVQDEISLNIARALHETFARPAATVVDPAVYDLYLRATPASYAPDELRTRIEMLEVVTQRAPNFVLAWSRLAYLRAWLHMYLPFRDRAANAARVTDESARGLAVDPNDADALVARLFVLPPYGHFAESTALLERVRELRGAADGLRYTGWFLRTTGRVREALAESERAYRLDSCDAMSANLLALARMAAGQVAESIPLYEDLVQRMPGMSFPLSSLLRAHAFQSDWVAVDRLLAVAEQRQMREFEDGLSFIRAKRDPTPKTIAAWHDAMTAQVRDTGCTDLSRLVYTAHLGLVDEAYALAGAARLGPTGAASDVMGPDGYRTSLMFQVNMPELRNDPRFVRLCARLGLVEFWQQSGIWPDCVDEVPYDFRAACANVGDVTAEPDAY